MGKPSGIQVKNIYGDFKLKNPHFSLPILCNNISALKGLTMVLFSVRGHSV